MIDLEEIKNKIITKNNLYCLLIIVIVFFLDRYSKFKIIEDFSDNIVYINEVLNFNLTWNTGIGFGLLSSNSTLFYNSISILIGIVITYLIYLIYNMDRFEKISFSIVIGGALGNFYDRVQFQAVPDFIDLHFKDFHWFTFNLADIFITIGVLSFLIKGFLVKNK